MNDVIALHNGTILEVHNPERCKGQFCCIHWPSDHTMREFPLNWRADRQLMERVCPHGIGHPDPDDLAHKARTGRAGRHEGVHGCDGCCRGARRDPARWTADGELLA